MKSRQQSRAEEDIVERLAKNAAALENGPYCGVRELRESMLIAKAEIERLRTEPHQ